MNPPLVNVICMKWGTLYGPAYVRALQRGVSRHLRRPHRFVCFTDDVSGLEREVECLPLPTLNLPAGQADTRWRKLGVFADKLADLTGSTLFLDLDLVVVGPLDPFFELATEVPGAMPLIRDDELFRPKPLRRLRPARDRFLASVGNSSVFRFEIGQHTELLDEYLDDAAGAAGRFERSQEFQSAALARRGQLAYWPKGWCVSFKNHCVPRHIRSYFADPEVPAGARIVVFAGNLKMTEVLAGGGHRLHRHIGRVDWLHEAWQG